MARPGYRRLPHTADLRLVVWGDRFEDLCRSAIRGALHEALGRPPRGQPERYLEVISDECEDDLRLVRIVNEALYLLYARRLVSTAVRQGSGRLYLGVLPLPAGLAPQTEVKAATLHAIPKAASGGRRRLVLTLDL